MTQLEPGQQLVGRGPVAVTMERVADDVWLMRGGAIPPLVHRIMNVYFVEAEGGVTVFDAGVRSMARHIEAVGRAMGGISRIVLGHAHPDHRGAAARIDVPVWCHEDEAGYAEAADGQPYTDFSSIPAWTKAGPARAAIWTMHHAIWDAGPVRVERTLAEGDAVAGFEVVHLPGHAPGQIALWREADRLALTSDCFYMLDAVTGEPAEPQVPLDPFNLDTEQARTSVAKLASLGAVTCCPGHLGPLTEEAVAKLEQAAGRIAATA
ncbi:MAG: MBL fold metallo-hydrolase [Actinobacteria bacterium]|nr:MBL fold metallo-hydrolase [Actinomycetota bacterium]